VDYLDWIFLLFFILKFEKFTYTIRVVIERILCNEEYPTENYCKM